MSASVLVTRFWVGEGQNWTGEGENRKLYWLILKYSVFLEQLCKIETLQTQNLMIYKFLMMFNWIACLLCLRFKSHGAIKLECKRKWLFECDK